MNINDSLYQFRPLFSDEYAEKGKSYYYRVIARNSAGSSKPSNVVGPVVNDSEYLVDELINDAKLFAYDRELKFVFREPRPYKEDASRLKGTAGNWLIYRLREPIDSAEVLTFMEGTEVDFEFFVSVDGKAFLPVKPVISRFPTEVNPYGYKLPVKYELSDSSGRNVFLKIIYKTDAQLSRVRIEYGK
jgi:hypothetical protein